MEIATVDPHDDDAFAAWCTVLAAGHEDTWPGTPGWQSIELRAAALDTSSYTTVGLAAVDSGSTVGAARVRVPLHDNLHLVLATVDLHPGHRRCGVGSALLAEVERRTREFGRSTVVLEHNEPARLAGRSPGRAFARRHGYAAAQVEERRELALPPDEDRLTALEAACLPYAAGYRLVGWRDRCPDELVDDRALLARRISTDAPRGELQIEEEQWDGARVRANEAMLRAQDRTFLAAGAVHEASGRLVAVTEIGIPLGVPELAYQWDTLVLREHRGHRLGTLVKIANLRALATASPPSRCVATWNATTNAPMIAVNDALGCEVVGTLVEWQKHLGREAPAAT